MCVATFTQNSSLKTHIKKHLESQQLACPHCGMMGLDYDLLTAHEKYHASVAKVGAAEMDFYVCITRRRRPPSSWAWRRTAAACWRGRRRSSSARRRGPC